MQVSIENVLKLFKLRRILIPIILGLGVATFLVIRNFDRAAYADLRWDGTVVFWLLVGLSMLVVRDLMYMYRIRILTDKKLSWRSSFDVIMIWEFASSVTPSIVGGTAAAFFLLAKEKISAGRSTATVLLTAFLDELFFIIFTPLLFLIVGFAAFPALDPEFSNEVLFGRSIVIVFVIGYIVLFSYTVLLAYGLFINPRGLKWLIIKLFSIKFLLKWKQDAIQIGNDVVITSAEYLKKSWTFWAKVFGATILTWSARYLMLNFILLAFFSLNDHLVIYARQLVMWVILLITPLPGGSGVAEGIFPQFFNDYIPASIAPSIGILWRLMGYYPYLFIGAIVLPAWIRRVFIKQKEKSD